MGGVSAATYFYIPTAFFSVAVMARVHNAPPPRTCAAKRTHTRQACPHLQRICQGKHWASAMYKRGLDRTTFFSNCSSIQISFNFIQHQTCSSIRTSSSSSWRQSCRLVLPCRYVSFLQSIKLTDNLYSPIDSDYGSQYGST